MTTPVMCLHGWAGSFEATWVRSGFTALLADAGRPVIGVDLLGHGEAPKPHDAEAYEDLTTRVVDALDQADGPVDAVGFSLGALTLLRTAQTHPARFHRLVLAGIGTNVFHRDDSGVQRILAGLAGTADDTDTMARHFAQYADEPGNDRHALAAVLRATPRIAITPDSVRAVTCPTLVIVGDRDPVHPPDELVEALPDARGVSLRGVDHFATPEAFGFIDAALEFFDAVPV